MDTKLRILAQKIQVIEKNEKVLGRTLIAQHQKILELSKKAPGAVKVPEGIEDRLKDMEEKLRDLERKIDEVSKALSEKAGKFATKDDVKELKYLFETLNPLEFVTVDQIYAIIEEKLKKLLRELKP